jgi:hypothetical protein
MNKLVFALAGAALALGACSSGGDEGDNVLNAAATEDLNQSASDAANAADAEAAALGDQLNQLENTPATNEPVEDTSDAQEQNVAGM